MMNKLKRFEVEIVDHITKSVRTVFIRAKNKTDVRQRVGNFQIKSITEVK